ncbi:hypothetical protein F4553_000711 [Allocatelliglobosispora scoriae]|uniref:Uncharacterized protein n=1 Tax=Allocatelliglobosispora scoriae TaxID=643052 RepID=A0A841BKQ2_9ACTN|nr:DUF5682 family protein [Allocatelliglobosispora scoriae]MBB5867332.1 hypothetical protein [Allocatelliglobosispora scoriae]
MTTTFDALRGQLLDAAATLADGPDALAGILSGIVDDVDRALAERLEIFPVCHHSPASAIAMARRLRAKQPRVVYLELCEDMAPLLTELRNCRLPVAVQAFAGEVDGFPQEWSPLSVVAPITEASAEYQAISYALDTPGVELVLVDRSTDHVYQWQPRDHDPAAEPAPAEPADAESPPAEEAAMHGDAVGVEIGDLRPRFAELEAHLLHHGRVRHWSEWWDQYVEQPLADADYDTYRQVLVLIGSLFRRLAPGRHDRVRVDEDRERYMWTRMREHLAASGTDPGDCLYVCGAFHAASRVAEFGVDGTDTFEITPRTATVWRYGLIPSSHSSIEAQFGLAAGSVSIAAAVWAKSLTRSGVTPYQLEGQQGTRKPPKKAKPVAPAVPGAPVTDQLSGFLARPPVLDRLDEDELLGWCVEIVRLARRNGYLASTADAIAVFETSILLAGMRGRARPTPYDFQDAAVTCIEKDAVPGRRDVRRLCEILLGGDRIGQVGYDALPPLARDVYDRLTPLGLKLDQRGVQRALLDIAAKPELAKCSDVLWILRYLLPTGAVRPIMGERTLGEKAIQESWDVAIGTHQRDLVEIGYEGVTIEQVLEQRLRRSVWDPQATAAVALRAVEDATLYLRSARLADELGARAVELLAAERTVDDAPEVLRRARRLLAHYRATEPVLPAWLEGFVKAGYAHYCTLLPAAFVDDEAGAQQVAAMLGFLFSMESLALSLGCDRAQLEIAVAQSHPQAPAKTALHWAARYHLGGMTRAELRERCDALLSSPLTLPAYPQYLSGFLQALEPVPGLVGFVVEAISTAFGRLPDTVLLPWLPALITTLRKEGGDLAPLLVREAGRIFPAGLAAVDAWTPPWSAAAAVPQAAARRPTGPSAATALLAGHPAAADALAALLGCEDGWQLDGGQEAHQAHQAHGLLQRHPESAEALLAAIGPG